MKFQIVDNALEAYTIWFQQFPGPHLGKGPNIHSFKDLDS